MKKVRPPVNYGHGVRGRSDGRSQGSDVGIRTGATSGGQTARHRKRHRDGTPAAWGLRYGTGPTQSGEVPADLPRFEVCPNSAFGMAPGNLVTRIRVPRHAARLDVEATWNSLPMAPVVRES